MACQMSILQVDAISMLLEHKLAGKNITAPKVVMEPVKSEKIEEGIPGVLPSCIAIRTQARKVAKDARPSLNMDLYKVGTK